MQIKCLSFLCTVPTSQWVDFTWGFYHWLTTPMLIVLPLLLLTGLPFYLRSRRWKRRLSIPVAILLLVYLVAISPPVASLAIQGLVHFVPADSGAIAETIVMLNRGEAFRKSRVEEAAQLWRSRRAPKIFASGVGDASPMLELLKAKGIPSNILFGETCSRTTQENALFTAAMLGPQGIRQILLITDPPHMLRSFLTYRSFGFTVIPHISPLPPNLTSAKLAVLAFREYLGVVSYSLLGRFKQRSAAELKHPSGDLLEKLSAWNCRLTSSPPKSKILGGDSLKSLQEFSASTGAS